MRQRWLLAGTIGVLFLAGLSRFVYLPFVATIGEQRAMLQDLRVKLADAQGLVERVPIQEAALQQDQERSRTLERRIDNGQSIARILETLRQQAKDHELELVAVQPRAEAYEHPALTIQPDLILRETPLTLQLTGRYRQVGEFLGELATAPFLASVRTVTVTKPDAQSPKLRADLVLAVYLPERSSSSP